MTVEGPIHKPWLGESRLQGESYFHAQGPIPAHHDQTAQIVLQKIEHYKTKTENNNNNNNNKMTHVHGKQYYHLDKASQMTNRVENSKKKLKWLLQKDKIILQRQGMESLHFTWANVCTWPTRLHVICPVVWSWAEGEREITPSLFSQKRSYNFSKTKSG